MKAEDIIWGGNNKGVIRLKNDIGLEPGTLVNIEYDYIKEVYYLNRDVERVDISAAENVIEMLNNIYLTGTAPTTMVWVVDKEENLNYIIEIKVFREEITFGKLNAIEIKIGDEVIDKMRIRDKENPIAYLDNAFKYGDRVFVRGYGRKGASFTILSADKTLNVRQVGNEYIATKLVRYDKSRADMEAVFILKGDLSFVDSSRSAFVSGEVAQKMEVITSGGEYFDIWDAYNDLDRIFAFRQATENGVLKYSTCTSVLTDAFEYCFTIEGDDIEAFPEGTQIDCTDNDDILKIDTFTKVDQLGDLRSTSVGVFDRIENGNNYGMEIGRRSKKREKEAARIIKEVKKVLAIAPKKSIGIISFYKSQSDYLKDIAKTELTDAQNDRVEIGTVDAFQGKEFDVVFLSCVRANVIDLEDRRHRIGHIDDLSRLCVSFTRARQLMVAVGDRETVECIPALADFIGRCREGGSYYE